jgi:phosphoribosylformylglycinamidine synthase
MVGLIPDVFQVCGLGWQTGDLIYLLGFAQQMQRLICLFGWFRILAAIHGLVAGSPPLLILSWRKKFNW